MQHLIDQWRNQAADYLRISKHYGRCASTAAVKTGYVKGAAILRECADQLENDVADQAASAQAREAARAVVQDGTASGTTSGQEESDTQCEDQGT